MARKWLASIVGLILIGVAAFTAFYPVGAQEDGDFTWAGTRPAPDFPAGLTWLNVPEPLSFEEDLIGKIVVLDFWTYGCINCMHIIPELKRLEEEYPNELVVIGVHSAKFENESVTENIRQVIQRYGIMHPVVNDEDLTLMQYVWGAPAWPTVIVVDPLGKVVGAHSGEGVYGVLAPVIESMEEEYGAAGLLNTTPIRLTPEVVADTPLSFPGKVIADEAGRRLFIADSGHNRIVVADLDNYDVLQVIGTGTAGLADGDLAAAQFNTPQGMALVDETLYVADTNNHVIRAIDLANGTVSTVAGTGAMATVTIDSGEALEIALRSPWDVLALDDTLYIAMAGSHQLFALNLTDMTLEPYAGNSGEDLIDGERLSAELAQPSGLATDGESLYFADSEASAIRRVIFADDVVETIIGPVNEEQGRLFEFGDIDGGIDEARLQHPLGVAVTPDGELYIADTYNSKIKLIDVAEKTVTSFAGQTEGGYVDGNLEEALFDEPGGLDYAEGKLYIADTNNHLIRVLDLESHEVVSVTFPNVTMLMPESAETAVADTQAAIDNILGNEPLVLPVQDVAPGAGSVWIDAVMPFGYKLNAQAPFTAVWTVNDLVDIADDVEDYRVITPELPIEFPATFTEGQTELNLDLTIYWCEAINESLCFVERRTVIMPINVSAAAAAQMVQLQYNLVPPDVSTNGFQ